MARPVSQVFAHRGAHLEHRENTLEAFAAAVALGVDGVELDVRRTLDRALVVHHDAAVASRPIATTMREELPDYVPSLAAAMAVLHGLRVNVEIKNSPDPGESHYDATGDLVRAVLDLLHEGGDVDRVLISCFDLRTCAQVRDEDVDVPVAWLVEKGPLSAALTRAHVLGLDGVNPHFRLVGPDSVAEARALGLELNVWTVNRAKDLTAMARYGVASVITDQPARALALFGRGPGGVAEGAPGGGGLD